MCRALSLVFVSCLVMMHAAKAGKLGGEQEPIKIVDCTVFGNCSNNHDEHPDSYGYAPSIVKINGVYHVFYCSRGQNTGRYRSGAWDAIRYTSSSDWTHWTKPTVKLTASAPGNKSDFAACDPSVVKYNGYYYLFYGSARISPQGNTQTVIQVARSKSIDGRYLTLTQSGTWMPSPTNPKVLIAPLNDVAGYGAGQPSVIIYENKLRMWYTDDTGSGNKATAYRPIYMLESTDPATWRPSLAAQTDYEGTPNADVKFDSDAQRFKLYSIAQGESGSAEEITVSISTDGKHWTKATSANVPGFPTRYYSHDLGVSGDDRGAILHGEPTLFAFGAPFDLSLSLPQQSWGRWNLYGVPATVR